MTVGGEIASSPAPFRVGLAHLSKSLNSPSRLGHLRNYFFFCLRVTCFLSVFLSGRVGVVVLFVSHSSHLSFSGTQKPHPCSHPVREPEPQRLREIALSPAASSSSPGAGRASPGDLVGGWGRWGCVISSLGTDRGARGARGAPPAAGGAPAPVAVPSAAPHGRLGEQLPGLGGGACGRAVRAAELPVALLKAPAWAHDPRPAPRGAGGGRGH